MGPLRICSYKDVFMTPSLEIFAALLLSPLATVAAPLEKGVFAPPPEARLTAYGWWHNGNVAKESITRVLEQMHAKGFGAAVICDAGGDTQDGKRSVPPGPVFSSARNGAHSSAPPCMKRIGLDWH
jgi:hypothetical protein